VTIFFVKLIFEGSKDFRLGNSPITRCDLSSATIRLSFFLSKRSNVLIPPPLSPEHDSKRKFIKGTAEKAKGAIKDTVGKVTGDKELQTREKLDKAKGSVDAVERAEAVEVAEVAVATPMGAAGAVSTTIRNSKRPRRYLNQFGQP
jgi:uncharacterized protein YjbJ (UPF0337 family)